MGRSANSRMSVTVELTGVMRFSDPVRTLPAGRMTLPARIALTTSSVDMR